MSRFKWTVFSRSFDILPIYPASLEAISEPAPRAVRTPPGTCQTCTLEDHFN